MCCWAKVTASVGNTANGLISNHDHSSNKGFGINIKKISDSDFRICCSTGNGNGRTYYTYYGTSNIKDAWHHLALTYSNTKHEFKLWVDGICEKTQSYTNSSFASKVSIFDWSITHNSYHPACSLNDVRIYDHCLSDKEVEEISKGLILHYKLDDIFDNEKIYDSSGYNNDGTIVGSLSTVTDSIRYNCSTYFADGVNDHIVIDSTNFPKDNITMSIWFKTSNTSPTGNHHWLFGCNLSYQMSIRGTDGALCIGYYLNNKRYAKQIVSKNLINNEWHMCTSTYDGNNIKIFIDGVLEYSIVIDNEYINGLLSDRTYFYLGRAENNYAVKECYISDARIYATALTEAQVKELYNTSATIDNLGNAYARELVEI